LENVASKTGQLHQMGQMHLGYGFQLAGLFPRRSKFPGTYRKSKVINGKGID